MHALPQPCQAQWGHMQAMIRSGELERQLGWKGTRRLLAVISQFALPETQQLHHSLPST